MEMTETTNKKLKNILINKFDNLTKESKRSFDEAPQCSYINLKGVQCKTKCINSVCDDQARCALHINCKEVKQCSFIHDEDKSQCLTLTRSATGYVIIIVYLLTIEKRVKSIIMLIEKKYLKVKNYQG
jgi:hypothetical protein